MTATPSSRHPDDAAITSIRDQEAQLRASTRSKSRAVSQAKAQHEITSKALPTADRLAASVRSSQHRLDQRLKGMDICILMDTTGSMVSYVVTMILAL